MSTLTQVRQGIKATIDAANIPGMTVYAEVPESVKVPCVIVEPDKNMQHDFGGGMCVNLDLVVLVVRTDSQRGQAELDQYITMYGDYSIQKVINSNGNLGLTDTDSVCKGFDNYGAKFNVGGIDYIGAVVKMMAITEGS